MQYEIVWPSISERFGLKTPTPRIYTQPSELNHAYQQLEKLRTELHEQSNFWHKLRRKLSPHTQSFEESSAKNTMENIEHATKGDHGLTLGLAHLEKNKASLYSVGAFVPRSQHKDFTGLHELLHIAYLEAYPQFWVLNNYSTLIGGDLFGSELIHFYFESLNEGFTWNSTLKLSHLIGKDNKETRKYFQQSTDSPDKASGMTIREMTAFLESRTDVVADPLPTLHRYFKDTFEIAITNVNNELKAKGKQLKIDYPHLTSDVERSVQKVRNLSTEIFRINRDGSTIKVK